MAHPYPRHQSNLPYKGKHHYFLTFCTDQRRQVFSDPDVVQLVWTQFLRAAAERRFEIIAYCFMPDHVHLAIHGTAGHSDCKAFIKAAKQYSGYAFKQRQIIRLWQRYGFERVIRDNVELALTIRYIISNPVRAGLARHPSDYPRLGSQIHSSPSCCRCMSTGPSPLIFRLKAEATVSGSRNLLPDGGSHGVPI